MIVFESPSVTPANVMAATSVRPNIPTDEPAGNPPPACVPKFHPWQQGLFAAGVPFGQNGHWSICVGPMLAGYHRA